MAGKLIVLIDSDAKDLGLLEGMIRFVSPDSKCISFVFSDEAIHAVSEYLNSTPDFIFINVNVSRLPGAECLSRLRKLEGLARCNIVMFSDVMPAAVGEAFRKLGADYYFQKPSGPLQYRDTISSVLNHQVAA